MVCRWVEALQRRHKILILQKPSSRSSSLKRLRVQPTVLSMHSTNLPARLREPAPADKENLAKLQALCKKWNRDPEDFTTRYLNLTVTSPFFRAHPKRAVQLLEEKYLCPSPIDARTIEPTEVPIREQIKNAPESPLEAFAAVLPRSRDSNMGRFPAPSQKTIESIQPTLQPLPACRYAELQTAFIEMRRKNNIRNADIAGTLNYSVSWISTAEADAKTLAPTFFLSRRIICAYAAGKMTDIERLERLAVATFYPEGIRSLSDMVKFFAYSNEETLESFAKKLDITNLSLKLSDGNRSNFSLSEKLALRLYLQQQIAAFAHVGLSYQLLDCVLPDPMQALRDPTTDFGEMLSTWAKHFAGSENMDFFVTQVMQENKEKENPAKNVLYRWRTGNGLTRILPAMVAVLEGNPQTRYLFADCKEAFLEAANRKISKSPAMPLGR